MAKTKSTGRRKKNRKKNRSRKGKGKGKLDIVKLINVLEKALSNVKEGKSIYKESNGKELMDILYNDLEKLTKSKGNKKKLIKKLKIICQKMYYMISSSINPKFLRDLNNIAPNEKGPKKSTKGPSFEILKGGVYIPGLSEAAAAFVVKQTAIAIGTAVTYVVVKGAMAMSVQFEAAENIKKQTKEAANKARLDMEEQLRKSGLNDEAIEKWKREFGNRLDINKAMKEVECQNNGGTMIPDGDIRRCVCNPKDLKEGTNCYSIVKGVKDAFIKDRKNVDYGPPVTKKMKSRQFLKDAKKNLNAIALPSSVSSANAIPRGDIINNGHKFSASDLIELDRAFTESEGGPVHLPDHIKGKLVDNIRSSQVSNLEDIFIEIEIGDGLSHITPTVIMRMLNNLQISIKKISSEIAIQGMSDIGTRIRRVTDVGTGGTTYGWLSMFSGSLKKIDKMGASWKRQRVNSDKGIEIRKNMVKLIYNNLVAALEDILATFFSASADASKLWDDAQWGVLTLGATLVAKEGLIVAILNELNNLRLGQLDKDGYTPILQIMDGTGKKKMVKNKKSEKKTRNRRKKTRNQGNRTRNQGNRTRNRKKKSH